MRTPPDGHSGRPGAQFLSPASAFAPGLTYCTNDHYHGASAVTTTGGTLDTCPAKRAMGVEPTQTAWKAVVLPLHHARTEERCRRSQRLSNIRSRLGCGLLPGRCSKNRLGQAWTGKDLNLRRLLPADLQSAPFDHSGTRPQSHNSKPTEGFEPPTCGLQNHCSAN
jgi:hypothetical protein